MRTPILLSILLLSLPGLASELVGKVVSITDGDTLTLLVDRVQYKIRLAEIDAPEKNQAFGQRSRQSLAGLCFGQTAVVQWTATDRYARIVGRLKCAGIDANAEQISRGMAWVYDRYVRDKTLYRRQEEAKSARRGLWATEEQVPPWEWRRAARGRDRTAMQSVTPTNVRWAEIRARGR